MIKPLKHTNREMDTVVTIVLSHKDTSKVAVGGGEGAHGHKHCHRPIVLSLKGTKKKQINSEHSNTLLPLPTYTVVELICDAMTWLWVGPVCKREGRVWGGWLGWSLS